MTFNTPDAPTENKASTAKKGYSIWSLLVIITLLAVWMAIPRRITSESLGIPLFFLCHQLALWVLIGVSLWLVLGRRIWVLLIVVAVIVLMWTPITMAVVESALTGNRVNTLGERLVNSIGLRDYYDFVVRSIYIGLGYGSS